MLSRVFNVISVSSFESERTVDALRVGDAVRAFPLFDLVVLFSLFMVVMEEEEFVWRGPGGGFWVERAREDRRGDMFEFEDNRESWLR